ncbi:MAG: cyclophilin-like fold protein [Nostoc sp.]
MMFSATFLFGNSVGCSQYRSAFGGNTNINNQSSNAANETKGNKMIKIKIGSKTFNATLFDNATANAFKAMLPLTLKMDELNGNEKKYDFSNNLPTDSSNPKTINKGDLMVWGSNTLVLFYKTFPTQYSYTKLGRMDDLSGLEAAVGSGNVTVTFELE